MSRVDNRPHGLNKYRCLNYSSLEGGENDAEEFGRTAASSDRG
jgi:hypothetical protein